MIIRKFWYKEKGYFKRYEYEGWFLFGIIPIYIRRITVFKT